MSSSYRFNSDSILTIGQLNELFNVLQSRHINSGKNSDLRNYHLIRLSFDSGIPVSELISLRLYEGRKFLSDHQKYIRHQTLAFESMSVLISMNDGVSEWLIPGEGKAHLSLRNLQKMVEGLPVYSPGRRITLQNIQTTRQLLILAVEQLEIPIETLFPSFSSPLFGGQFRFIRSDLEPKSK